MDKPFDVLRIFSENLLISLTLIFTERDCVVNLYLWEHPVYFLAKLLIDVEDVVSGVHRLSKLFFNIIVSAIHQTGSIWDATPVFVLYNINGKTEIQK